MEKRYFIDCREFPGSNCSLRLSGNKQDVVEEAIHHATTRHNYPNTPDLRNKLEDLLKEDVTDREPAKV